MADLFTSASFEELIQSDLFTFHIGEEKKPFVVHSKAIAATSPVFDRLVNGGLRESQDRAADFEDVDPDTFTRFLEYAYRRDYTTPAWAQDTTVTIDNGRKGLVTATSPPQKRFVDLGEDFASEQAAEIGIEPGFTDYVPNGWSNSNSAPSDYGAIYYTNKYKKQDKNPLNRRAAFNKREYTHPTYNALDLLRSQFEPFMNTSPTQNFAPVFLAHARLYTLADMRMVQPLKDLALHKLHKTLAGFELYPERLGDVAELVRYAYEHGEDRSENGRIDALRDMVVNYIVCEVKVLGKHAEFRNLMDGGGELAGDFWDIVTQELH